MFVCLYVCSFIDLVVCLFVCLLGCLFGSVLGPSEFDGGIALMPSCRDGLRQESSEIPRIGLISTGPRDHFRRNRKNWIKHAAFMHPYSPSLEITECFDEVPGWPACPKYVSGPEKISALA